jgi:ribulose-5-phosphate 4-epimerase/fuculose-1-phosphate aldolase
VVHAHPVHAPALACLHREIPPFHYMVALPGGNSIRGCGCAPFGTVELAGLALEALENRTACLLANHGILALGPTPAAASEEDSAGARWSHLSAPLRPFGPYHPCAPRTRAFR